MALTPTYCPSPPVGPTIPSNFSPNVIPFIDGSSNWNEAAVFTYQNGRLGIGNNNPQSTVHITGNSDVTGKAFQVDSLSNNLLNVYNNGTFEFNGTTSNNTTFFSVKRGGNNILSVYRGSSSYSTGVRISSENGTPALDIGGFNSSGSIEPRIIGQITPVNIVDGIKFTTPTRGNGGTSFNFNSNGTYNMYASIPQTHIGITGIISASGGAGRSILINASLTINQTGGTGENIFINYNPTITSITGAHYGLLIRPDTMSGFGLGATMPTAVVHLAASTTARASLRIDAGTAPTSPNDGDIWNDGTDLYVRLGGTTYKIKKEI